MSSKCVNCGDEIEPLAESRSTRKESIGVCYECSLEYVFMGTIGEYDVIGVDSNDGPDTLPEVPDELMEMDNATLGGSGKPPLWKRVLWWFK